MLSFDRPADAAAEVVAVELGLPGLEESLLAEILIAVELEDAAAELVRAALRDHADRRAGVAAELGRRIVGDDLELLNGLDVRRDDHRPAPWAIVDAGTIDHGVVTGLAYAVCRHAHALLGPSAKP